jgi:hypothetical protein
MAQLVASTCYRYRGARRPLAARLRYATSPRRPFNSVQAIFTWSRSVRPAQKRALPVSHWLATRISGENPPARLLATTSALADRDRQIWHAPGVNSTSLRMASTSRCSHCPKQRRTTAGCLAFRRAGTTVPWQRKIRRPVEYERA